MNEKEFKLITVASREYVGLYIKFYRERVGISQAKLAKLLKMSAQDIGQYEIGNRGPSIKFLNKLCDGINKYVEENKIIIAR